MMIDWKPIETAPQYGKFLVYCVGFDQPVVAFKHEGGIIRAMGGKVKDATHWAEFNLPEPGAAPAPISFEQMYLETQGYVDGRQKIFQALDEELARMRGEIAELRARGEGRGNARS